MCNNMISFETVFRRAGVLAALSSVSIASAASEIFPDARIDRVVSAVTAEWDQPLNPQDAVSTDIPKTAMLGNGDIGVVSGGRGAIKTFTISKSDFWSCGDLKGKFSGREEYKTKPLPVGELTIMPKSRSSDPVQFNERLDIREAKLTTRLKTAEGATIEITARALATENVLLVRIAADRPTTCRLELWARGNNPSFPARTIEALPGVARSTLNAAPENPESWRSEVVLAANILQPGGQPVSMNASEAGELATEIEVRPERSIWVALAVGGGGRTWDASGKLAGKAPELAAREILGKTGSEQQMNQLVEEHQKWWSQYWHASAIDLDDSDPELALIERYYYGAQYLMGAGIRPGKTAPGLYGIWHTTDTPKWSSDYHLNYNFIAAFYGAPSSNRCEYLLSAAQAMFDYAQAGERRAADPRELRRIDRQHVDERPRLKKGVANAVLYPVGIGPWGTTTDDGYHRELVNAAYSSWPIIQYYRYTRDREFLKPAYEFLTKCARMYEAWIDQRPDGSLELTAGYNEGSWSQNPAVELAAFKMVLTGMDEMGFYLGLPEEVRGHWMEIFNKLPAQPTANVQGKKVYALAAREWNQQAWKPMANPAPQGANVIALDSILPGGFLNRFSPQEERQIAINTLDVYGPSVWGQMNNFPRVFYDAVEVGYPADKVTKEMARTIKAQLAPNLAIRDGVHGLEKIGAVAAINAMLATYGGSICEVFPNWPKDKNASFTRLRVPGGFLLSAEYDKKLQTVTRLEVQSLEGEFACIVRPWTSGTIVVTDSHGAPQEVTFGKTPDQTRETILFSTQPGETYTIARKP